MKPLHYIGIDIGATGIKTGLVTSDGKPVSRAGFETKNLTGPDHFVSTSKDAIGRLLKAHAIEKADVGGIGVGAPGWVDYSKGVVRELTNMPGWHDVPLAELLEEATGLKSVVDNDANVMAMAELSYGAGHGHNNFICLTLGTGVGGAVVIDGEVYRGADGLAGEIGHIVLDLNGRPCVCGGRGCLERYVGNRFIVTNALERLEKRPKGGTKSTLLNLANGQTENITPKLLAEAAAQGDELAIEVWRETGHYLGVALAVLVNLLNPECFIIGGGVAEAGPVLFEPMRETMGLLAMNGLGRTTPIFEAQLGEDAGLIGAAAFAMRRAE